MTPGYHLNSLVSTQRRIFIMGGIALTFTVILVICATLSILSYNRATKAFNAVTTEQQARVDQNTADNLRIRRSFCGLVQEYAAVPLAPNSTSTALQHQKDFAATAATLGCTPDPYDNQ